MKKIVTILAITILMVGCSNSKKTGNINDALSSLKENDTFIFQNMINFNDAMLLSEIGISDNYVEDYIIAKSNNEIKDFYIIVKPKKKYENEVQNLIKSYIITLSSKKRMEETDFNTMECIDDCKTSEKISNYLFKEYKGYLIYIVSDNNDMVFKSIKSELR